MNAYIQLQDKERVVSITLNQLRSEKKYNKKQIL